MLIVNGNSYEIQSWGNMLGDMVCFTFLNKTVAEANEILNGVEEAEIDGTSYENIRAWGICENGDGTTSVTVNFYSDIEIAIKKTANGVDNHTEQIASLEDVQGLQEETLLTLMTEILPELLGGEDEEITD